MIYRTEQAKDILKYLRLFKGRRRISDQGLLVSKWKRDSGMKLVFYCRLLIRKALVLDIFLWVRHNALVIGFNMSGVGGEGLLFVKQNGNWDVSLRPRRDQGGTGVWGSHVACSISQDTPLHRGCSVCRLFTSLAWELLCAFQETVIIRSI